MNDVASTSTLSIGPYALDDTGAPEHYPSEPMWWDDVASTGTLSICGNAQGGGDDSCDHEQYEETGGVAA